MKFEEIKFGKLYDGVQAIIEFGQYELSVIKHSTSYGGKKGLYEIAVFEGDTQTELPGITQEGDTVQGFLCEEGLNVIFKKMTTVTGSLGTQVFK
jgi:hypothetical protein